MPSIFSLDGPLRIDPGKTGLKTATFAFVNTSAFPICDVNISTWDSDVFGASPEVVAGGCSIETFAPKQGPNNTIGIDNLTGLTKGADWKRTNDDGDTARTKIDFTTCIAPGKGFTLNLKFDETLDGNEGIDISPSRLLPNGEHSSIGGVIKEPPGPFTFTDLLEILGKIGAALPLGSLLGASGGQGAGKTKTVAKIRNRLDTATSLALEASVDAAFMDTQVGRLGELPLGAVAGMAPGKIEFFQQMGIHTIRDLFEDADVKKMMLLYELSRDTTSLLSRLPSRLT